MQRSSNFAQLSFSQVPSYSGVNQAINIKTGPVCVKKKRISLSSQCKIEQ